MKALNAFIQLLNICVVTLMVAECFKGRLGVTKNNNVSWYSITCINKSVNMCYSSCDCLHFSCVICAGVPTWFTQILGGFVREFQINAKACKGCCLEGGSICVSLDHGVWIAVNSPM